MVELVKKDVGKGQSFELAACYYICYCKNCFCKSSKLKEIKQFLPEGLLNGIAQAKS